MKSTLILLTLLLCLFFSCKKKSDDVPAVQNIYCSKIIQPNIGAYTYTYDNQNRLSTETFSPTVATPSSTYKVEKYTANGSIEEALYTVNDGINTRTKIIKNTFNADGKVIRQNYYDQQTSVLEKYYTAVYSTGAIRINLFSAANAALDYFIYTSSADGKNYTNLKTYPDNIYTYLFTYSNFESQKTFESLFPTGKSISPTQLNTNLKDANTTTGTSTTYTCEYNADGYVTKKTNTANGSYIAYEYVKR
jgi:hypothetical protein